MAAEWELLLGLFEGALERPKHERAAFLDEHTKNDPALRREIETLLAAHEGAAPFLSRPALAAPAEPPELAPPPRHSSPVRTRLVAGTSLGAFTVLEPLGAGGMGEVYRARDTRLDRFVAINWSHDDREIFYRTEDGTVISVPVSRGPTPLDLILGKPVRVVTPVNTIRDFSGPTYDVSPDGRRFLFIKAPELDIRSLQVILNWDVAVRAAVAPAK